MTSLEKFKWKLITFVCVTLISSAVLWYFEYYWSAVIVESISCLITFCGYILDNAVGKEDRNEW